MQEFLTIYTATYNRKRLLERLYESLCKQTCKNFRWMIVDDGSTDGTKTEIDGWINEHKIIIEYYYKMNGGIHTARDFAYQNIKTELLVGIDSDDWIKENFVEEIFIIWSSKPNNIEYAGIFMPIQIYGKSANLLPNILAATYQQLTYKYKYKGDKTTILRSDIIKTLPISPCYVNEKLVPESYKWIQLPNIPFLISNNSFKIVEYQSDGISSNQRRNWFENLNGFRENYRQHIISSKYLKPKMKGHIGYILCSIYLKDKHMIKHSPRPLVTCLLFPFTYFVFLYTKYKWKKYL